jgi:uncharacterized protein YbjT (DUF2867 family)
MTGEPLRRTTLVTGATGHQGGAVLAALLRRGERVRGLVRDPEEARASALAQLGVELVGGDLLDSSELASAMRGVDGAFGLTIPGKDPEHELAQGRALIAAAREVGLPHLVLASVASASEAPEVPHFASKAQLESLAADSGVPTTVIAPTWFFENLLTHRAQIASGTMALALPSDRPLQALALADLGELVATVLAHGPYPGGRRIELAGDELTPAELAGALSQVVGVEIRHQQLSLSDLGAPTSDLPAMYAFLARSGYHVDILGLRKEFPDVGWHRFREWAAEQQWPRAR